MGMKIVWKGINFFHSVTLKEQLSQKDSIEPLETNLRN